MDLESHCHPSPVSRRGRKLRPRHRKTSRFRKHENSTEVKCLKRNKMNKQNIEQCALSLRLLNLQVFPFLGNKWSSNSRPAPFLSEPWKHLLNISWLVRFLHLIGCSDMFQWLDWMFLIFKQVIAVHSSFSDKLLSDFLHSTRSFQAILTLSLLVNCAGTACVCS